MNNLEIIKDYSFALWDTKDLSVIDKYFAEDALIHSPLSTSQGIQKMKVIIQKWYDAFPNLKVTWDDFICENEKVVSRWHAEGEHQGMFLEYPSSNKKITYSGITIYQFSNKKIKEYWALVDMHSILNQITS